MGASTVLWGLAGPNPCPDPGVCDGDYRAFLQAAAGEGSPVSQAELRDRIGGMFNGGTTFEEGPVEADVLRDIVVDATNLGFLLDGIESRDLSVTEVDRRPWGAGTELELTLEDPWVGAFGALLFLPSAEPPWTGVVAHPGHWEEAWEHRDLRHVDALLNSGFAVAVLEPRVHEADALESEITEAMLLAGHTFMAVRVYETLLLRRLLRAHEHVHPDHVGLMGHSGGSASGNLALRLDDGWLAYASDFLTEYLYVTPEWEYVDETVPDLHRWFPVLNELDTASTPARVFDYGFPEGGEAVVEFFCSAS